MLAKRQSESGLWAPNAPNSWPKRWPLAAAPSGFIPTKSFPLTTKKCRRIWRKQRSCLNRRRPLIKCGLRSLGDLTTNLKQSCFIIGQKSLVGWHGGRRWSKPWFEREHQQERFGNLCFLPDRPCYGIMRSKAKKNRKSLDINRFRRSGSCCVRRPGAAKRLHQCG
jgi:hypothetical protein